MLNWFHRVISQEKDSIIDKLTKDSSIIDAIKYCNTQIEAIPRSANLRNQIIETAERINEILHGANLHKVSRNISEVGHLSKFLECLFAVFEMIPPKNAGSICVFNTILILMQICGVNIYYSNWYRVPIHLCMIFSIYPVFEKNVCISYEYLLANESFCQILCSSGFMILAISELFSQPEMKSSIECLYTKFLNVSNDVYPVKNDNLHIINVIIESLEKKTISDENVSVSIKYITLFLVINAEVSPSIIDEFERKKGYRLIHDNLIEIDTDTLNDVIIRFSSCPKNTLNRGVMLFLYDLIIQHPHSEKSVFIILNALSQLLNSPKFAFIEFEYVFPLHSVLAPNINLTPEIATMIISLFQSFVMNSFSKIAYCIQPIFKIISSITLNDNTIIDILSTLWSLLSNNSINTKTFIENSFIEMFIDPVNSKHLGTLARSFPVFIDIFQACYSSITDPIYHWKIMNSFFVIEKQFAHSSKFTQICSSLFSMIPSSQLVIKMMDYTESNTSESLISIFVTSFCENAEVAVLFIGNNGLEWVNRLITSNMFPVHMLSVFIASILHHRSFDEVSIWITTLPLTHPIFKLPLPMIYHIVFGSNATAPTALRVPALLPLLPSPKIKLSPHSVYVASRSAMSEFIRHGIDLNSNQIISEIANRYLSPSQFQYLLKNSKSISSFVDIALDHFPLFEFAPGSRDSAFSITSQPKSISFWVKFETQTVSPLTVFSCEQLSIAYLNGCLNIGSGEDKLSIACTVKEWLFISLSINQDNPKACISFSLNDKIHSFGSKSSSLSLTQIIFGSFEQICTSRWYIGSAIRLFPQVVTNFHQLYQSGPGYISISQNSDEQSIITPNSSLTKQGQGCLSVPYCGFPLYLTSKYPFFEVVDEIFSSNNIQRIQDRIGTLINTHIIFPNSIPKFWNQMKLIMKEKRDILTSDSVKGIINTLGLLNIGFLRESIIETIFFDLDLWSLFPIELLYGLYSLTKTNMITQNMFSKLHIESVLFSQAYIIENDCLKCDILKIILKIGLKFKIVRLFHFVLSFLIISSVKLQEKIAEMILNCLMKRLDSIVSSVFTFEILLDILITSPKALSNTIMKIIVLISSSLSSYTSFSYPLVVALSGSIKSHEMWIQLLSLLSGGFRYDYNSSINEYVSSPIAVPVFFPTFLCIVFCSMIVLFASYNNVDVLNDIQYLEKDLHDIIYAITSYAKKDNMIFAGEEFFELIAFFIPLVFNPNDLFLFDNPSNYQSDGKSIHEDSYNIAEFLKIWGVPENLLEYFMNMDRPSPRLTSQSPFSSSLIQMILEYSPSTVLPNNNVSCPLPLQEKPGPIVDFFGAILMSQISQPDSFRTLIREMVFNSSIRHCSGFEKYSIKFIVSLLCRSQLISAPIASLEFLFIEIANGIDDKVFGDRVSILISSCLPVFQALFSIKSGREELTFHSDVLVLASRLIMLSMFKYCSQESILGIFEIMNSMKTFLFNSSEIFSDFLFSSTFFYKIVTINEQKDPRFFELLDYILNQLINVASFLSKWEERYDIVSHLRMTKFINGISVYVKRGCTGFHDWVRENRDVYNGIIKQLGDIASEFGSNKTFKTNNSHEEEASKKRFKKIMSKLSTSFNIKTQKFFSTNGKMKSIVNNVIKWEINRMMRLMEKDHINLWHMYHNCYQQSSSAFSPKSYRISPISWPFFTPRLVVPSYFPLPIIKKDGACSQEDFLIAYNVCDSIFSATFCEMFELYPHKFTQFYPIGSISMHPSHYFKIPFNDKKMIYYSFVQSYSHYGTIEYCFTANFLKYSEFISCVVFVFKQTFCILLNSKYENDEIYLEDSINAPIVFINLIQTIQMGMLGQYSMFCGHVVLIVPFNYVLYANSHLWIHKQLGISINAFSIGEIILICPDGIPVQFIKSLQNNTSLNNSSFPEHVLFLHSLSLFQSTQQWSAKNISNDEYLLVLNSYGGRSFSDLAQYPIFPWIISDYESSSLPLKNYRDLSKPMGQLNDDRAKQFDNTFKESNGSYYYGAHYSMAASVHYFLLRLPPFTFFEWDLHNGWDNPFRMFFDMERSWQSSSEVNTNDVKELMPEFYHVPEVFDNLNGFSFYEGKFEISLPKWAKDSTHFVNVCLDSLESLSISEWIDLIFGVSQYGPQATIAKNLFIPISYHNHVSKEYDDDTLSLQLQHWGQCPIQLFKKPHPQRTNGPSISHICSDHSIISTVILTDPNILNQYSIYYDQSPLSFLIFSNSGTIRGIISNSNLTLSLSYVNSSSSLLNVYDYCFGFATHCSLSSNDIFLVVDKSTCSSIVFRLFYSKGGISEAKLVQEFCHNQPSTTIINGQDFICASYCGSTLTIWDFIRGVLHRIIHKNLEIINCGFDEYRGWIWCLTAFSLSLYTINGVLIHEHQFSSPATLLLVLRVHSTDIIRPVFVGLENGSVLAMNYDLESHTIINIMSYKIRLGPITKLVMHSSKCSLFIEDQKGSKACVFAKGHFDLIQ